jgi:soluble lytic murein transglycosylase-like protein
VSARRVPSARGACARARYLRPRARGLATTLGPVALAVLAFEPAARADFRYVDRDGRVHEVAVDAAAAPVEAPSAQGAPAPQSDADLAGAPDFPYGSIVREAAALYSLPVALLRAVIQVESGFQPRAVSVTGAAGLMQLMPATASDLGVRDRFDPRENLLAGARHLRLLINAFDGDLALALAAYHAGPQAVRRAGGVPAYPETRRYVALVVSLFHRWDGAPPAVARR